MFCPLCLLVAFSLNIIVVFLSCPGSRYCLTKYFMEQSSRYLPAISYLLSKIKGSSWGGGWREREGLFCCFYFKVSHMQQMHKAPGSLGGASFICWGQGWPHIYLFTYLFTAYSAVEGSCLRFSVSLRFPFLFVQKGKVQSASVSRGKSLLHTNPPAPACDDLERGALNGPPCKPACVFC